MRNATVIALFGLAGSAHAGGGGVEQYAGGSASASWSAHDECGFTSGGVFGAEQTSHVSSSGQPWTTVEVRADFWHVDWCTGESWEAHGASTTGLSITRLDAATIELAVDRLEPVCGEQPDGGWACPSVVVETATVAVTFTGVGDTESGNYLDSQMGGGIVLAHRGHGSYREATVTGSLVLGGRELLAGDTYADLSQNLGGQRYRGGF